MRLMSFALTTDQIRRVLASGASYDLRELRRNVLAACPTATVQTIREAMERMVAGGTVDRIVDGEAPRYRKLARRRELSA